MAPSDIAVAGRYILTPEIFEILASLDSQSQTAELQLTDAIAKLLQYSLVEALQFEGRRYDCGSKLGMLQATLAVAKHHPEVSAYFNEWLKAEIAQ